MKVKNWMHPDPVVVQRDTLLQEAVALMQEHSIRHLPVMEGDELVGFITMSDLRQYFFPSMVEDIPVHEVMVLNPLTVNVNSSIEKAARLIHDFKIGGLPVMDKKKLVGVITSSDIVSGFIEVMGLLKSSTRLDVIVDKDSGVEDVTRIIKSHHLEIMSVATESQPSRRKVYFFRLGKGDIDPVVRDLEKAGHKVLSVMD
ncbi:MAG: CBS and ACT domain-containing protein [Proteobacteria bacterium]|nr:CBS and ACT domain-containing protein [Pseudomonadota bacterium]MBU1738741.1 CBS and ACT domain-containing protein [Pseudomonadota bacterium]